MVRCHDAREQFTNRGIARKLLYEKLDLLLNGETSKVEMRAAKVKRTKDRYDRRRKAKLNAETGE